MVDTVIAGKPDTNDAADSEAPKEEEAKTPEEENVDDPKTEDNHDQDVDQDDPDSDADEADSEDGDDKSDGAPEEYDFKIDENITVNEDMLEEFKALAKKRGYSNEEAQELLNLQIQTEKANHERIQNAFDEAVTGWLEESKKDKTIGGKDFQKNVGIAVAAVEHYGGDDVKELLNSSGIGNHPAILRMLVKVGKTLQNDDIMVEGNNRPRKKSLEQNLYGNSDHN